MSEMMKITPEQILSYANTLKSLNGQLAEILTSSKTQIDSLQGSWTGTASEATISAFNGFANKYFGNYQQMIDAYVQFLTKNVAESYSQTQQINTDLADLLG